MRKSLILSVSVLAACLATARADSISGTVIDSSSSLPIKGVKVKVSGSSLVDSALTDSLGRFSLQVSLPVGIASMAGQKIKAQTSLSVRNGSFFWQGASSRLSIQVLNAAGRRVFSAAANSPSGSFNLPNMATGLYLIKFNLGDRVETHRYLKLSNTSASLLGNAEVEVAPSALAKQAAVSFTAVFSKTSFQDYSVSFSGNLSGQEIKLQSIPFPAYRVYGMNFSPYIDGQNPNTGIFIAKSQIIERMSIVRPYTLSVRAFSTTHGFNVIGDVAHRFGLKTWIGAWIGRDSVANNAEVDSLIAMAKRGEVDTAIIGSEAMLRRDITEARLIQYLNQFRAAVPNVPVATADVYGELTSRPNLIAACDFVYGNFYPYWEGAKVDYAVANLHSSYEGLEKISGGKEVIISEAGWPSAGAVNGQSVPSLENAAFYFLNFVSWARAESIKIFYFEAFDEAWKTNEGTVGPNWGLFTSKGVLKDGMQKVFDGDTMANNWTGTTLIDGEGTPSISFTKVPAMGSTENLEGRVSHVIPKDYGVVVYIKVGGGWWIKPTFASPVSRINVDGSWICDVTTGGYDTQATEYKAFLIPADYAPPSNINSLPADKKIAEVSVTRS